MKRNDKGLTYAAAGVDIAAANRAVELMRQAVRRTFRPGVLTDIGGFGGLFALDTEKYREPVLVSGTDGVGTKLRVAFMADRHDTVGIDLVAMCVNDILVHGAEPLFFLDYLAVGRLEPEKVAAIIEGVSWGCRKAGCALIGGETAEMPGFYAPDEYDLAGFVVGVVERSRVISGADIRAGDLLIGCASAGLHSNGYSLARKVLFDVANYEIDNYLPSLGRTVGEELLVPTRIYVRPVLSVLKRFKVRGMAHITGGGLLENIPRILPRGVAVRLRRGTWPVPGIFSLIQELGGVEESEMYRTFNMGIGFVLVVPPAEADQVIAALREHREPAFLIGEVVRGQNEVQLA
ncbi:phosphoribosylformylglycinamidine cyclo-ligase [Candidatus Desulforudis audaxviator MP104C]|uniref:Phosphoribosylformylglycinamidine cyclo-ligase n=1 Tax=Desulforudis audaxviator (strain MP104C) TaxID=477974 RepID=B1I581_DESAP|nr:phosphoribosylformylglycinamidine cyclo-ligase [Candidatus Desulforudis audaxviator]ACA60133.1 phosphoribosylformylglycinamidine cyclo-ligase [Candidatus Desulforudis audaxviator MP104C]AZK60169.1 Phosphoribosylformylglycinamidine cyclo-ligase [Candidatus Desulforudis audaxviator]